MKRVELYGRVRHAVMIEGPEPTRSGSLFWDRPAHGQEDVELFGATGLCPDAASGPPEARSVHRYYRPYILEEDKDRPKKQRHTSKRIFERLRDEYGFTGKITIVKDYICGVRQRRREMFVPLTHPPGHAQVDFGEAPGRHRRRGTQDPLPGDGPTPLGRLLCEGLSGGDHGGLL